jgi:hypothetical protein
VIARQVALVKDLACNIPYIPLFLLERYTEVRERGFSPKISLPLLQKKRGTDHRFAWFHKGAPTPEGVIFGAKLAKGLSWVAPEV